MKSIGAGPEAVAFYHTENVDGETNYVELASEAVDVLFRNEDVEVAGAEGLMFNSPDMYEGAASELDYDIRQEWGDAAFRFDQKASGEIRTLQTASAMHSELVTDDLDNAYSVAVTAGANGQGDEVAVAYLIGDEPFLEVSKQSGSEGTYSERNNHTTARNEELDHMKGALDGFIDAAIGYKVDVGSSQVHMNNSDLVNPMENIASTFFSLGEFDDYRQAAAWGFGRLARQADSYELGFESDPDTRDDEEYLQLLLESDDFEEFYSEAVEPALELRNHLGEFDKGDLSLSRVSALEDAKENDKSGLMMVGSFSTAGRTAEVIAEELVDEPVIHLESENNLF